MYEIDPSWWTTEEADGVAMPEVLRRRDFGAVFRWLNHRGWSHNMIARATNLETKGVRRFINEGRVATSYEMIERIVVGLQIPRYLCGIGNQPSSHTEDRTELQRLLSGSHRLDQIEVDTLVAHTDHLRHVDRLMGSAVAAAQLDLHIDALQACKDHSLSPAVRERLDEALSDALAFQAWLALDQGRLVESWRLHERAKEASASAASHVHAWAQQSYLLLELDRPDQAWDIAQRALTAAGTTVPRLLRAWLEAVTAEMAAAAGRQDWAVGFGRASELLASTSSDPHLPYIVLDTSHLARWKGTAAVRFGDHEAIATLQDALRQLDGSFKRARAGAYIDLGGSLAAAGRRPEAAASLKSGRNIAFQMCSHRHLVRANQLASMWSIR